MLKEVNSKTPHRDEITTQLIKIESSYRGSAQLIEFDLAMRTFESSGFIKSYNMQTDKENGITYVKISIAYNDGSAEGFDFINFKPSIPWFNGGIYD